MRIARILGQDDWLIYARTETGELVYTVIECDPAWLDAPYQGDAIYGSRDWRADNAFMQERVTRNKDSYYWQSCGLDTDGKRLDWPVSQDDAFSERATAHYLTVSGIDNRETLYRSAITYAELHTDSGQAEREEFAQAYADTYMGISEPPSPESFQFYRRVRETELFS